MGKRTHSKRKRTPGKASPTPGRAGRSWFVALSITVILAVVATAPLLRGLWFPSERYLALLFLFLAAAIRLLLNYENRVMRVGALEAMAAGLAVMYVASVIWAVDHRAALDAALNQAAYLVLFLVLGGHARTLEGRRSILTTLVISPGLVAGASLLMAAGLVPFPGAIFGGRVAGPLQYANALGGFMAAGFLVAAGQATGAPGWKRTAAGMSAALQLTVLWATSSRGALLALVAGLAFYTWSLPSSARRSALARLAWLLLAGSLGGIGTSAALAAGQTVLALLSATLALTLSALPPPIPRSTPTAATPRGVVPGNTAMAASLLVALVITAGWSMAASAARQESLRAAFGVETADAGPASEAIPAVGRVAEAAAGDLSLKARLVYDRDAARIFLDRFWSGAGGGGWAALYKSYQSYGYTTRNVHNNYLQAAVEIGLAGLLLWGGIAGWVVWRARFLRRSGSAADRASPGVAAAAFALLVHAGVDFTLSFPAIGLYLWALLAWLRGTEPAESDRPAPAEPPAQWLSGPLRWGALASLTLAAASCLTLFTAERQARAAEAAWRLGDVTTALSRYDKAISLDRWNAEWRTGKALLLAQAGNAERATAELEVAVSLTPAPRFHTYLAEIMEHGADSPAVFRRAAAHREEAVALDPFRPAGWDELAQTYIRLAIAHLKANDAGSAREAARSVIDLTRRMDAYRGRVPGWVPAEKRLSDDSAVYALARGQALAILGQDREAAAVLAGIKHGHPGLPADARLRAVLLTEAVAWRLAISSESGDGTAPTAVAGKVNVMSEAIEIRKLLSTPEYK